MITRQYVGEDEKIETTIEEATKYLEGRGYWKPGTVAEMIGIAKEKPVTIRTPWAYFTFTN